MFKAEVAVGREQPTGRRATQGCQLHFFDEPFGWRTVSVTDQHATID